jgi:hypothetical protein
MNLEWQHHEHSAGRTDTYGVRIETKLGFSPKFSMTIELPVAYADNSETVDDATGNGKADSLFGVGDLRLRLFYLPYKKKKKGLSSFGISADVFMPTGNPNYYLGSGDWVLAPGVIWGLFAAQWLQIYPILSYSATIPGVPDTGREIKHALTLQAYFVFRLPAKVFFQVIPYYTQVLSPSTDALFNTEFALGWQKNKHGLSARYLRQFVGDEGIIDQVRISYMYFF